jgi:hypothetical protein
VARKVENAIRTRLARGEGMLRVAKGLGVGVSTVQRIKLETRLGLPEAATPSGYGAVSMTGFSQLGGAN